MYRTSMISELTITFNVFQITDVCVRLYLLWVYIVYVQLNYVMYVIFVCVPKWATYVTELGLVN